VAAASDQGRLIRLAESHRAPLHFYLDGVERQALHGDTVLTAVLLSAGSLRSAEFGIERRAGFCLMGACQDCWMWQEDGPRIRACSTPVRAGMRLLKDPPKTWPGELP
jgi:predicted molibdopterin-dependent oxidoreductase YjgC